jgi:hypothetical protein
VDRVTLCAEAIGKCVELVAGALELVRHLVLDFLRTRGEAYE